MLACAVNVSEGRDRSALETLGAAAESALLDLHSDPFHNRAVLTLGGPRVEEAARSLARAVVAHLDLRSQSGVHPRLGVLDVVPFAPLGAHLDDAMDLGEALAARDAFARFAAGQLGLPCFYYGPERSLPDIRRHAFQDLAPDHGPAVADPRLGAVCVGARPPLIAYNVVLRGGDLTGAKAIARSIRSDSVRALGLQIGSRVQVSCNLVAPWRFGPAELYDAVAAQAAVEGAELVGLLPDQVLAAIDPARFGELDVSPDRTFEYRVRQLTGD